MEKIKNIVPLATVIIAFCAVFTALGLMFNILLNPLKENQVRIELEVNARFDKVNARFDKVNARFDKVNARFDKVHEKLDRLLSQENR